MKKLKDSNGILYYSGNRKHRRFLSATKDKKDKKEIIKISKKYKKPKELLKRGVCNYFQSREVIEKHSKLKLI